MIPELLEQPVHNRELGFERGALVWSKLRPVALDPFDQGSRPRYQRGYLCGVRPW